MVKHETDALVVGAGPVGLMAALALSDAGVETVLIDEARRAASHSYALALHPGSLRLLERYGLSQDVLRRGHRIDRVCLYNEHGPLHTIEMGVVGGEFPYAMVLRQDDLEDLIGSALRRSARVHWQHRLAALEPRPESVLATVHELANESLGYAAAEQGTVVERAHRVHADYVLGCDGHRSLVRRMAGIHFDKVGQTSYMGVFEFYSGDTPPNEVRVVLTEHSTNVLWPLPGGRYRWSFQLLGSDFSGDTRFKSRSPMEDDPLWADDLYEQRLRHLLEQRAPWFDAQIGEITWAMAVRFERRLASAFGGDRIWLAGDSAHMTGPVGVQSMNVGLREAVDLAEDIERLVHGRSQGTILDYYNTQRQREWRGLLGLEPVFQPGPLTNPWVAEQWPRLLGCIPASGADLAAIAQSLGVQADACAAAVV